MKNVFLKKVSSGFALLSLTLLFLSASASQAQPISPTAGLPTLTYSFNHTSIVSIAGVSYDFNYFDFNITGFTNVGANNPSYDILGFSNSGLEKEPGVVAVASAYLPAGWTFSDTNDFLISIAPNQAIHADDPSFGLIFIQALGTAPINPSDSPFLIYHAQDGVDPFTLNGLPIQITATPAVPEASTTVTFGLLLALGALSCQASRRKKSV